MKLTMADLDRLIRPLSSRIRSVISRGVISLVDDTPMVQQLQVDALADETLDELENFGIYGVKSVPLPGAECVVHFAGGQRAHGIVVGIEDRRHRPTGWQPGEVGLYDDLQNEIRLGRDELSITAVSKLHVKAPVVLVEADTVQLAGEGGKKVALDGDPVVGGKIQATSQKVTAA